VLTRVSFLILYSKIIPHCSAPAAVILASLSVLIFARGCHNARRRRYTNQRLRAAALRRDASGPFPGAQGGDSDGEENGEDSDVEHGIGDHLQQQQSGSPLPTTRPPKLPAIVLHPDLSTVDLAIKEEEYNYSNNNNTEGQMNRQGTVLSTLNTSIPASPASAAAVLLFNGRRGGFRRSNTGQHRRQQRARTSAPRPALVTVEIDGSPPKDEEEEDETSSSSENAEETPAPS